MEKKLKFLGSLLPVLAKERQQKLFAWRAENLITRAEFIAYGKSEFITGIKNDLDDLVCGRKTAQDFTLDRCSQIRDYLMVMLVMGNALRASNLLKMSVKVIE